MRCRDCGRKITPHQATDKWRDQISGGWLVQVLKLRNVQPPSSFWHDGEYLVCESSYDADASKWKWHKPNLPEPGDMDDLLALERELR